MSPRSATTPPRSRRSATTQVRKQLEEKIVRKLELGEQRKMSVWWQWLLSSKFKYNA